MLGCDKVIQCEQPCAIIVAVNIIIITIVIIIVVVVPVICSQ